MLYAPKKCLKTRSESLFFFKASSSTIDDNDDASGYESDDEEDEEPSPKLSEKIKETFMKSIEKLKNVAGNVKNKV